MLELIDRLKNESLKPAAEAGAPLGVPGRKVSRWARHGVKKKGQTIRLEAIVLPGSVSTSTEAIVRFLERVGNPAATAVAC